MKDFDLTGIGAWYIRASDEKQDKASQRSFVEKFLTARATTVDKKFRYEDVGERSAHETRLDFRRLLKDAAAGKFNWIVIDEASRIMTDKALKTMAYLSLLSDAGVRVYAIKDGLDLTDDETESAVIMTALKANQTGSEVKGFGFRVLRGMYEKVAAGRYPGGPVPFGMHLVCLDPSGQEKWRLAYAADGEKWKISGKLKEIYGKDNTPGKDKTDILVVRPSNDKKEIETARYIFNVYAEEAISMSALADRLNDMSISCRGDVWDSNRIRSVLESSYFIGYTTWNKTRQGKYYEIIDGERVVKDKANKSYLRDKKDWIKTKLPFEPVIDEKIWQKVQEKREEAMIRQAPKTAKLIFSSLLYCAQCGVMMRGSANDSPSQKKGKYAHVTYEPVYFCASYVDRKTLARKGIVCTCGRNMIKQGQLEKVVEGWIGDSKEALSKLDAMPDESLLDGQKEETFKAGCKIATQIGKMARFITEHTDDEIKAVKPAIPDDPDFIDDYLGSIVETYTALYRKDEKANRDRLSKLEAEHETLTDAILKLPAGSIALEKKKAKLVEMEVELRALTQKLADATQDYAAARSEFLATMKAYDDAEALLRAGGDNLRRKAEAIRAVIERIDLRFSENAIAITIQPRSGVGSTVTVGRPAKRRFSDRPKTRRTEACPGTS